MSLMFFLLEDSARFGEGEPGPSARIVFVDCCVYQVDVISGPSDLVGWEEYRF